MVNDNVFEGIRVIDFSWAVAGPNVTRYLGCYGAEVIKIESRERPDHTRSFQPYRDNKPGLNRSCDFAFYNTSKLAITLNLRDARGVEVVKRLAKVGDIVVENFSPGVLGSLGLSYDDFKEVNPQIIMLSSTSLGQVGPYSDMRGMGTGIQAFAGFPAITGFPGQEPLAPYYAYPDIIACWNGIIALTGALIYRRRTGKGQYIDLSMIDISADVLAPAILDYTVNGREGQPPGNRVGHAAPHGVYRCRGEDQWCAITIFSEEEWVAFSRVVGDQGWSKEPRFSTLAGRKENEDELDGYVEEWTLNRSPEEVMALMQSAGIGAGVVQGGRELLQDPQLAHRHHYITVEGHQELGTHLTEGPSFILPENPYQARPAPILGQDNYYVFTEILGFSDEEFVELIESGVVG